MYLGQKDAVQCLVLQKLARDLCVPSMVEVLPTVRESDGLAMSSRNRYLSPEERQRAAVVPASLFAAQAAFNGGQLKRTALFDVATRKLKEQPALEVQYISLMDAEGVEQDEAKSGMILSFAGKLGSTRLIDAIKL
jgi:pantoate--beta-alanine ligase